MRTEKRGGNAGLSGLGYLMLSVALLVLLSSCSFQPPKPSEAKGQGRESSDDLDIPEPVRQEPVEQASEAAQADIGSEDIFYEPKIMNIDEAYPASVLAEYKFPILFSGPLDDEHAPSISEAVESYDPGKCASINDETGKKKCFDMLNKKEAFDKRNEQLCLVFDENSDDFRQCAAGVVAGVAVDAKDFDACRNFIQDAALAALCEKDYLGFEIEAKKKEEQNSALAKLKKEMSLCAALEAGKSGECQDKILLKSSIILESDSYCPYSSHAAAEKMCIAGYNLDRARKTNDRRFCDNIDAGGPANTWHEEVSRIKGECLGENQ